MLLVAVLVVNLAQSLVFANTVISWHPDYFSSQVAFIYHKKAESKNEVEMKSPSGKLYKVICETFPEESPKADVFREDGMHLDSLILESVETPCDQTKLNNYIVPQDPTGEDDVLIYLWAGKDPNCVKRSFRATSRDVVAFVERKGYSRFDCPDSVQQFIKSFGEDKEKEAGGVVNVILPGASDVFGYNPNVAKQGENTFIKFPTKDLKDKSFKLTCRVDELKSEDPITKSNTITTGLLTHEDHEDFVLEKFKMTKCEVDNINVNRMIMYDRDFFKTVFKTDSGACFEREYQLYYSLSYYHYDQMSVSRSYLKKVECPNSFEGDIDLNAFRPWYKRSFIFKWFFSQPTKYMQAHNPKAE